MGKIAARKVHFAPLDRQASAIRRVLKAGRHRNVTDLMRSALDAYLERVAGPSLSQQARWMAEDWRRAGSRGRDPSALQDPSRLSDESW